MLQRFRDHIQGWVAGIVIALIGLAFVFWGVEYYVERSSGGGAAVAKVNSTEITEQALRNAYTRLQREVLAKQRGTPLTPTQQQQLREFALSRLVSQTVLVNAADKAGFHVSMDQVKQLIVQLPAFQQNGQFSQQRFQQILYASSSSPAQFFSQLQEDLLVSQVASGLQVTSFILPEEAQSAYDLLKQQRSFGYFIIPIKTFLKKVSVSDKQVQQYYDQHKSEFKTPAKVKVSYIALSPTEVSKEVSVTNEQALAYYKNNLANYTTPKRWKIQQVVAPLPADASKQQQEQAQQKLQQVRIKWQKGKVAQASTQWVSAAEVSDTLINVLNQLKPNQISQPLKTNKGYALIRMVSVTDAKAKPYSSVKESILTALKQQQIEKHLQSQSEKLSNLTYTNPTSLEPAAKALGIKIQTSPFITREGAKEGVLSDPIVLNAVFSADVQEEGNNSNVISLKDGTLLVVRVQENVKSKQQTLAEVKSKIVSLLKNQTAEREAGLKAYEVQQALNKGTSTKRLARTYRLGWQRKFDVVRDLDPSQKTDAIAQAAFAIVPNKTDKSSLGSTTLLLSNGNYAVIQLLSVKSGNFAKASSKNKSQITSGLQRFMGELDYKLYTDAARKATKIKINKEALAEALSQ